MPQIDFKKEWVKAKDNLNQFSKELSVLTKKGEQQMSRLSTLGKLHVDSTAMVLKKEHIFHLIGKEYLKMKCPGPQTSQMKALLSDLRDVNRKHRQARLAIKTVKK